MGRSRGRHRESHLFAGCKSGSRLALVTLTQLATAKFSSSDRQNWLTDYLSRFVDHKANGIDALLPWSYVVWSAQPDGRRAPTY